ncbi:MAG: hypothetical protein NTW28_05910, partial [Candidatus Solibacter sp.]|nr:hypothetical protein [Candidatus Solibacter sp.]
MSFQAQEPAAGGILTSIPVHSLTLQGFGNADLRPDHIQIARNAAVPDWRVIIPHSTLSVTSLSPTASLTLHDVTLDGLSFPARSSLTFSTDRQNPRSVAVRVNGGGASGSTSGGKQMDILCDACQITDNNPGGAQRVGMLRLRSAKPHVIDFRGRAEGIAIGFEATERVDIVEQRIAIAGDLTFTAFEPGRQISTISAGTLRLPEYGPRTIQMSAGDFLVAGGL